ncbi:winged helix-turn-helix domain-containing protein [Thermoproteota archaeon]
MENDNKRRDRLYIIAEILTIAKDGRLKTQIMYRANLSFTQLNDYLSFLTRMDLLQVQKENRKNIYSTTIKGDRYLEKYKDIAYLLGRDEENN